MLKKSASNRHSSIIIPLLILMLSSGYATAAKAKAKKEVKKTDIEIFQTNLQALAPEALRLAIEDLTLSYPNKYAAGANYGARLDALEKALGQIRDDKTAREKGPALLASLAALQREALIANPLVSGQPILYIVREQYKTDHHNTATMFVTGEVNTGSFRGGGAIKTIDFANGGKTRTLLDAGPEGLARDPEIHFDGQKIVFALRKNIRDNYHLYEIGADGSGLRQLTHAPTVADFDPLYMPDGSIVFTSTREPKYCMCNCHIMGNLFRMDADGANIHQIAKSTLHEGHSSLTPDGRILYDRWEYVDRNFGDAQGLWTVNPDGTNHCVYYGNNTNSPGGVIDARSLPGDGGQRILCIFGSCHDRPWGALTLLDRRLGLDGRPPVVRTWPAEAIERVGKGNWDAFVSVQPKYEDPMPLSDKYFLCSRMTGKGEQMGICLLDIFGNELILHVEAPDSNIIGCYDPMPLAPRERPPVIPAKRNFENRDGYFYIVDVYQGTHMEGVERGSAKTLRVVESPEKRYWTNTSWGGQGVHKPGMNWHNFENKRILGVAPIEPDGSAYVAVPSDKFLFFQILDENGMMIQSMRSGTMAQSGETQGCVGCHDHRLTAPPPTGSTGAPPQATQRPPSKLEGWHGPPRVFSFMAEVQPVFDKNCVKCHDYGKEAGKKLLLAPDRTNTFNTAYNELWRKKIITAIGAGPSQIQQAYSWGSHASKLIRVLRKGHNKVELDPESFDRIVTWIDLNAPYYPTYATAYPGNLAGRSPLDDAQIKRLEQITSVPLSRLASHDGNQGPQISFDRPELSPCLAKIDAPEALAEAIAIIRAGAAMLQKQPRADMPGFQPCPTDLQREKTYAMRQTAELLNRQAIQQGRKVYDKTTE